MLRTFQELVPGLLTDHPHHVIDKPEVLGCQ